MWDYLDFFIYIDGKTDCTGLEYKIKKWIREKNWNFIKIR